MHGFGSPAFHPPSATSHHTPGVVHTSAAMRMNMLRTNGMASPGFNTYPPPSLGMPGFAGLPTGASGYSGPSAAHNTAAHQLLALSPHAYVRQMSLSAAAAEAGVSPADLVAAAQALRARAARGSPPPPAPPRDSTAKALDFDGQAPPKRKRSAFKRQDASSVGTGSPSSSAGPGSAKGSRPSAPGRDGAAALKSASCVTQRFASNVNRRSDFRVPVEAVLHFQGGKALHSTGRGGCFSATADSRVMDDALRTSLLQAKPHPLILEMGHEAGGAPSAGSSSATPAARVSAGVPGSAASAVSAASMTSDASGEEGNGVSLRNGCMGILERDVAHAGAAALTGDAALLVSRLLLASQLPGDVFGVDRLAELRNAGVEPSTSRCQADERGMELYALGKQLWLAWIQLHCVKPFPTPYLSALLRHITGFTRRNEVDLYRNYRRRHLGSVVDAVREVAGVPGSPRQQSSSARQARKRPREEM